MSSSSITLQLLSIMVTHQTFGSVITNSSFTITSMTFENITAAYYILKVFAIVPRSFTYQSDPFMSTLSIPQLSRSDADILSLQPQTDGHYNLWDIRGPHYQEHHPHRCIISSGRGRFGCLSSSLPRKVVLFRAPGLVPKTPAKSTLKMKEAPQRKRRSMFNARPSKLKGQKFWKILSLHDLSVHYPLNRLY